MKKEIREKVLRIFKGESGELKLAAAMQNPIRLRLDHESLGRRLLMVDPLQVKVKVAKYELNGKKVALPEFNIESAVFELDMWKDVNLVKVTDHICDSIKEKEWKAILDLFSAAVKNSGQRINKQLNGNSIVEAMALIEGHELKAAYISMNPETFKKLKRVRKLRSMMDLATRKELKDIGYVGYLWGMNILVSEVVPVNRIYFSSEPEFVGVMPYIGMLRYL